MKKLASFLLVASGVLVAEQVVLRLYRIWWVRWWPLESPAGYVTDGLGRQLVPTPSFAGPLFGCQHHWIGWSMLIVDFWELTAGALCAYLLIRVGSLWFEKSVLKGKA